MKSVGSASARSDTAGSSVFSPMSSGISVPVNLSIGMPPLLELCSGSDFVMVQPEEALVPGVIGSSPAKPKVVGGSPPPSGDSDSVFSYPQQEMVSTASVAPGEAVVVWEGQGSL